MRRALAKRMVLRGKRKEYMNELHELEWASSEELKAYQQEALACVLTDARAKVPYYQTRVQGDRLEDFPILTRTQIQAFRDDLIVSERVNKKTHTEATSGTTSEPMTFVTDHGYRERGAVMKLFFYEWAKVDVGDSFIKFWGTFPAKTWYARMRNAISLWTRNTKVMNTFDLRSSIMDGYVEEIRRRKPKIILAYAVSFYEFVKYLDRKDVRVQIPGSIMTSTATLTPMMRETMERVFQCSVFDRYGSRELMDMACDCEYHQGLHVNPYLQYVEILDGNDNPCPPGQTGRIVVTQLHNPVMPFIRYDTQDYGAWAEQPCDCGRNWPMIKQIDGRRISMFQFREGGSMSSYYMIYHVNHVIGEKKIKKQQIIQEDYDRFTVKLVLYEPEDWLKMDTEREKINQIISERIGEPAKIQYELCEDIPRQPSGKFLQSICKIQEETA